MGAVGVECLSRPDVFNRAAAKPDQMGGRLTDLVHMQVAIMFLIFHKQVLSQVLLSLRVVSDIRG